MTTSTLSIVTNEQREQFKTEGWFILENCVPAEHLELLRESCQFFIDKTHAEMDEKGTDRILLSARGKRYFAGDCYQARPSMGQFIFSELMADICRGTIGEEAYLFCDQYVVKGTDKDSAFSWHQDSGYVHMDSPMYVSCWVTLDDVTLQNGTVFLLPYPRVGIKTVVKHVRDPRTNDMVGYFGSDPGIPAVVPAGSVVVFSSYVFHRSGPNLTDKLRRVYLAQFTPQIIRGPDGRQWGQSVPFLKDGEIVWSEGAEA